MDLKTRFAAVILTIILLAAASLKADESLKEAHEFLLAANPDALLKYEETLKKSADPSLAAEYAYALAYFGLGESALFNIDRALIMSPANPAVRFYLSEILKVAGIEDTGEIAACGRPKWLKRPLALESLKLAFDYGEEENFFDDVNLLMSQKRYAEAAALFARAPSEFRKKARFWRGWAITLDKLGAQKSAAAKVEKDIELSKNQVHKETARRYAEELLSRPSAGCAGKPKKRLKGRYLAYLGGNISGGDGRTVYNANMRLGKFISERMDISANLGYTGGYASGDYNGITIGAAARCNAPLKNTPFNATLAGKIERVPATSDNLSVIVSPGLSWFTRQGSLDTYLDIPLSGPYSGSPANLAVYFAGRL